MVVTKIMTKIMTKNDIAISAQAAAAERMIRARYPELSSYLDARSRRECAATIAARCNAVNAEMQAAITLMR